MKRTDESRAAMASAEPVRRPAGLGLATRGEVVLALQRQIGNAALGRLLQRRELEAQPLDGTSASQGTRICATGPTSAGASARPQRIDHEDPLIDTVVGPCLTHWAGGYHWFVRYRLPLPAQVSGFIIQELYQQGSGGSQEHFWEYWEVAANEREPPVSSRSDIPDNVTPAGVPYDDRYVHFVNPNESQSAQGWYRHVGVARFYPGPLPPQFTGDNRQTRQRPDGWTGAGTRHDCYAEWDRRPARRRMSGLVACAGSQEYRAGDTVNDHTPRPSFTPTP